MRIWKTGVVTDTRAALLLLGTWNDRSWRALVLEAGSRPAHIQVRFHGGAYGIECWRIECYSIAPDVVVALCDRRLVRRQSDIREAEEGPCLFLTEEGAAALDR